MIKEILDEFIVPKLWEHDRTKTIGSSEIGGCIRRTWYIKNSKDHDLSHVARWGAAERGNLFENHLWEPALRKKFGKKLMYSGPDQKTFVDGELSATPDGLLIGAARDSLKHLGIKDIGGNCLSLECKTIDPRVNLIEAKHQNMMQVQVAMGIIRAKTVHKPNYALISYANASFLDDITEFAIPFEENLYAAAKTRAAQIYKAKDAKELKPEGYIKGGKECDHCPFQEACGVERHNLPSAKYVTKEIDPQLKAEFIDMVRAANKIKAVKEGAEEEFKAAAEEIKDRLREKGIRKIEGVLNWSDTKGRQSYDMASLIAAAESKGIKTEKYSRVGEATSRLTLYEIAEDVSVMKAAKAETRKRKA